MNCSECGRPLLFDRVVFRCECGAHVHAYCVEKHIVSSHRPVLEEGYADLNGEFHLKNEPVPEPAPAGHATLSSTAVQPLDEDDQQNADLISVETVDEAFQSDANEPEPEDD